MVSVLDKIIAEKKNTLINLKNKYSSSSIIEKIKENKNNLNFVEKINENNKLNKFENILGKEAEYNAKKIKEIFTGTDNEFSVAVSLNAAAGLIVSEKVSNFNQAYKLARNQILSGKVYEHLIKITKF